MDINNIENEMLKYALDNGIIDLSYIQEQIEMTERKELLSKHESKIWQGKDGKWYTYLPDQTKGRRLIKKNSLEEVENIVIDKIKVDAIDPTVSEIFHEWNDRKLELKKISDSSHHRYEKFFNRHYSEFGQKKIKSITEIMILDFLEEQIPKYNLTAKGFSGLLGITRGFLKYAKKNGYISFNVEDMINDMDLTDSSFKKDIKEDYQEVFSDREVDTLFTYFIDNLDIWNIGLLLMFITGMRVGELVALKHSDIHEDSIDVRRTETVYKDQDGVNHCEVKDFPKTAAGVRTIIVPSDYLWVLQKIRLINPFGEYIFVNKENQRMSTFCFRNRLYRVCKKLNIYRKSPHKIRKTYGSILLDNHVDNRFIMKQMGHADITVTEASYHRDRREHEEKLNIISNIPQFKAQ